MTMPCQNEKKMTALMHRNFGTAWYGFNGFANAM